MGFNSNRLGAVIMVGGTGKRMGELTQTTPKPLLKVGRHAILDYILGSLETLGVPRENMVVVVKYLSEQIRAYLSNTGISVITGPQNSIALNLLEVLPDLPENFITASGDLYSPGLLQEAVAAHREGPAGATLVIARLGDDVPRRKYWRYTVTDGVLKDFERGPKLSGWERDLLILNRPAVEKISATVRLALQSGSPENKKYKDFSNSWNLILRLLLDAGLKIKTLQRRFCRCYRINFPQDLEKAAVFANQMKLNAAGGFK